MDGLSAAASSIAVVSLAIQVVDSVSKIRRFLHSLTDAPKELGRLVDLLQQLELILQQIVVLAQKQQSSGLGETDMLTNVMRAIKTCEAKLTMLGNIIEATKQSSSATGRAARTIESLKLACKKKDIQEFENQLRDAINLLTLTMMANLTYAHSENMEQILSHVTATSQATNTITQELAHLRTDLATNQRNDRDNTREVAKDCSQYYDRSKKPGNLSIQSTTFRKYTGLFGNLYMQKTSRSTNFRNGVIQPYTIDESNWIFMPSFLSSCFDFRYLSTCGNIQRSIRIYPVIPDNHEIWGMCGCGDLRGIQRLLSERQISPFSINSSGKTLLHYAAQYRGYTLCELLFEAGLTGEEIDIYGFPPHHFARHFGTLPVSEHFVQSFSRIYHLFASHIDDFGPVMFDTLIPLSYFLPNAHASKIVVSDFITKENVDSCGYLILYQAVEMLWKPFPTDRDHNIWKQITQHIISLFEDSQKYSRNRLEYPLLDQVMNFAQNPFDSLSIGCMFIDILSNLKVDVAAYLQAELEYHFDLSKSLPMLPKKGWLCSDEWPDRYLVISITPPSVSWDWYINPKGSAFAVLNEFKTFKNNCIDFAVYEEEFWPFSSSEYNELGSAPREDLSPKELSALNALEDRFQRRRQNKATKLAKSQGMYKWGRRVPGAWID